MEEKAGSGTQTEYNTKASNNIGGLKSALRYPRYILTLAFQCARVDKTKQIYSQRHVFT